MTIPYQKEAPETIRAMFGAIAPGYDRANAMMSLGMHHGWNKALARAALRKPVGQLLDLCGGTGEIARRVRELNPRVEVTLVDFSPEMVRLAQAKLGNGVKTLVADAHHLPLPDEAFDAVTCAYGLRNLNNPEQAAREVRRVLRPGGVWAILELTRPRSALWRLMHRLYLRRALPVLGRLAARDKAAYTYLPESIETWAPPSVWREVLQSAGFRPLEEKSLMGGIATLLVAEATWN